MERAQKNHFDLVISRYDKKRHVHLKCKMTGTATVMKAEDDQRDRKSVKADCPPIIKITYSKNEDDSLHSKREILEPNEKENVDAHNLTSTTDEAQCLPSH